MNLEPLRFLADESCDFSVVRVLREKRYDVVAACELATRTVDRDVIEWSYRERRILLTEDKDFGWLVFVSHVDSAGVILVRFPGNVRLTLPGAVADLVETRVDSIAGAFTVVEPGRVRISRRLPQRPIGGSQQVEQ